MQLYSRISGEGPPVLILHGLFGMSDNWVSIAHALNKKGYSTHILDLRNHGRSPHADSHRYTDMSEDILEYLDHQSLGEVVLMGHSMGGKLAMIHSLLHPEEIRSLIVVDMAPADYRARNSGFHENLIDTLLHVDLKRCKSRKEVRNVLEHTLKDKDLAMFLSKNLYKDDGGNIQWRLNLSVLKKYLRHLFIGLEDLEIYAPCPVPTLFIRGGSSDYYTDKDEEARKRFFPDSNLITIENTSHWLHAEKPELFSEEVLNFLSGNAS